MKTISGRSPCGQRNHAAAESDAVDVAKVQIAHQHRRAAAPAFRQAGQRDGTAHANPACIQQAIDRRQHGNRARHNHARVPTVVGSRQASAAATHTTQPA